MKQSWDLLCKKNTRRKSFKLQQEGIAVILQKCEINSDIQYGTQATTVIALQSLDIEKTIEEYKQKEIPLIFDTPQKCPPGYFTAIKDLFGKCFGSDSVRLKNDRV